MIDLEPFVGEIVCVLLQRPIPYMAKSGLQFEPVMVQSGPPEPGKQPQMVPVATEILQGRVEKMGSNYVMAYANPAKKSTRMRVTIDPRLVDAVYTHSDISIASPMDVPADPGPKVE